MIKLGVIGLGVGKMHMQGIVRGGKAEIAANAKPSCKHTAELVFQSVCVGFEVLATNYPEYVSYKILG